MGNCANVSQSPGVDGPWQATGGEPWQGGKHSCISRPQTHVDSVSLALPALVKVRQRDTRGERGRERSTMMDSALHPPLPSLPLRRLVTFQWGNYHCGMHNSLINYRCQCCLCFSMEEHHAKAASAETNGADERAASRDWRNGTLLRWLEVCQTILRLLLTEDGLETHGAEIRPIICLINLPLSMAALRGSSQVGPAPSVSVGNLVPTGGERSGVWWQQSNIPFTRSSWQTRHVVCPVRCACSVHCRGGKSESRQSQREGG